MKIGDIIFKYGHRLNKFRLEQLMAPLYRRQYSKDFEGVQRYCFFAGYPRSGHTLVGALLDAHRHMLISHELHALGLIQKGYSREALFARIMARAVWFRQRKNIWTNYSYRVPGQWQGRYEQLKVIGDKRGGKTSRALTRDPSLADKLEATVKLPVKIIHVLRNPYDNISTRARGGNIIRRQVDDQILQQHIDEHFRDVEAIHNLQQEKGKHIMHIRHEDFVADPRHYLKVLCDFLEVDCPDDYLDACCSIVFKSNSRSRDKIEWKEAFVRQVQERMQPYPFLQGYTFDN